METKNEKFVRLANMRADNIVEQIRIITNLSNTSNYEYSEEQIVVLFKRLEHELKQAKRTFLVGVDKLNEKKK